MVAVVVPVVMVRADQWVLRLLLWLVLGLLLQRLLGLLLLLW